MASEIGEYWGKEAGDEVGESDVDQVMQGILSQENKFYGKSLEYFKHECDFIQFKFWEDDFCSCIIVAQKTQKTR